MAGPAQAARQHAQPQRQPAGRNRPQVPMVVPMMGSHCTALVIPGCPGTHTSTRKKSITQWLRVRPEAMVRPQLRGGAESRRAGTH